MVKEKDYKTSQCGKLEAPDNLFTQDCSQRKSDLIL